MLNPGVYKVPSTAYGCSIKADSSLSVLLVQYPEELQDNLWEHIGIIWAWAL